MTTTTHLTLIVRRALVIALVIALAACSSKSKQSASQDDPLRTDMAVICGAAKASGGKHVVDLGPYIAENMKSAYKAELFADIRNITLDDFIARIRKLMAMTNVQQCDTVDVLIANDPRKKS